MVYNHKGWTQYIKEQNAKTRLLLIWQRAATACKEPLNEPTVVDEKVPEIDSRLMRVSEWKENPDPRLVEKILRQFRQGGTTLYKGKNYQRKENILNREWSPWDMKTAKKALKALIDHKVVKIMVGKVKPLPLALNNNPPKGSIAEGIINWVDENLGYRSLTMR